jgi:hypothetical protein
MTRKMRPAITLLITLSVIATMIALMGVMFKYLDVARDKAEIKASMIQANLLSADMVELLRQILGKKPSKNTMQTLFETPLGLRAESGEFMMGIACSPLANRVNIAWLETADNNRSSLAQSLFEMLTDTVNIRDAALLREKIRAALKRHSGVSFGVTSRLNEKKGIITFRKFQQLLDDYRYEADDKEVYQIPWQKYFSFGVNHQKVDGEFTTPEVLAFLYDTELSVVQSDYQWGALNTFLSEVGESRDTYKWLFSKKALAVAQCKASYSFRKGNYSFVFNYVNGRIEGFEFFGN